VAQVITAHRPMIGTGRIRPLADSKQATLKMGVVDDHNPPHRAWRLPFAEKLRDFGYPGIGVSEWHFN
jgi:hypothetical protein